MSRQRWQRRDPDLESLFRLAERTNLIDDPQVRKSLTVAAISENSYLKQQIAKLLTAKAAREQAQPFNDTSQRISPFSDRIQLGTTITGSTYTLEQDDLTRHLLAVGQSGAGKTTLFYNLMDQLTVPFWAFDLKQDYRHLLQDGPDLLVLPWSELRFNPLRPPDGVPPRRWAQVFSEMFGHATALLSGSKNYLMKRVITLYRLYGLFEDVSPPYPSLHELQQLLKAEKINYVRKTLWRWAV